MSRRIIVPEGSVVVGTFDLPGDVARHVRDVLRLGAGESVVLSDGAGLEAEAVLVRASKGSTTVLVAAGAIARTQPSRGPAITLFQGVGKGEKMDAIVRQATELGVARIVPVITERSIARQESRPSRWRAIAEDAVRVSGRPFRPSIESVVSIASIFSRERSEVALCLMLGAARSLREVLGPFADGDRDFSDARSVDLLIGPEGGFSEGETRQIESAGFVPVHLGTYTLRMESAGPAAIALVSFLAGCLE